MEGEEESITPKHYTRVSEFNEEPPEYQYFFTNYMNAAERLKQDIDEWREKHTDRIFLLDKMDLLDLLDYCFEMTECIVPAEEEDTSVMVSPPSDTEENNSFGSNIVNLIKDTFFHTQR